jgi:hypothetical protein
MSGLRNFPRTVDESFHCAEFCECEAVPKLSHERHLLLAIKIDNMSLSPSVRERHSRCRSKGAGQSGEKAGERRESERRASLVHSFVGMPS